MAKRRTKQQISFDKIIYNQNAVFGLEVLKEAKPISRRKDGTLQDEMNFSHPTDTSIMFFQMWYGAGLTPNTNPDPFGNPKNALKITIDSMVKENTNIIIGEINNYLLQDFKEKK
jgi:hypothetical protein